ncbi:hypothetical protein NA57DRAFT_35359 [Rhizodiscina lignyota]|uniref:GATA-type domain-containing protein n=1 Tax=Rhizodiscina lignyota TaxID=1504668 RepID=A0A9P4INE2_9PEZI|nr:hypothetical protein NA57DRAFT_35359 [Rhizodiscina lignyota]
MNYATAPAATSGGGSAPVCHNCQTSTTPLWRRDEFGSVLCNACGLFLKLHGRPRPISLKTDVIKSRNRVKASGQGPRKKSSGDSNGGLPAAHPDTANSSDPALSARRPSQKVSSAISDRSNSPISRSETPLTHTITHAHNSNIAPQHLFDGVGLTSHTFDSPALPSFALRQPSPSSASLNGSHDPTAGPSAPGSYDLETLKTRVSELEVINDLFRGRVSELEGSEQDARRQALAAQESEARIRQELGQAWEREKGLRKRLEELEAGEDGERKQKRPRLDSTNGFGSGASSPMSTNGVNGHGEV